jgi:hypothetical protein
MHQLEVILVSKAETARWFGSDVSPKAIENVVSQILQPYIKQIASVLDAGGDPKDVDPAGLLGHRSARVQRVRKYDA